MKKSAMLDVDIQNLDMEIAAKVAQWAVLKEIYLVDAKISREPLTVSPETLSLEHKCSTEMLEFDKEDEIRFIRCNFWVAAFSGEAPDNLIMKIEASFCTSYVMKSLPPDIPHDADGSLLLAYIEYLWTINPISDAWPYWREFVQSMSTRMGFPALTVPLLEIVPKKAKGKKEKRQPAKRKPAQRNKLSA